MVKSESISSKIKKKTRLAILTNFIPHRFESPSYTNQRRKKKEFNWKRKKNASLFAHGMILYIENPKMLPQKTTRAY